jgi:hypothetical protein
MDDVDLRDYEPNMRVEIVVFLQILLFNLDNIPDMPDWNDTSQDQYTKASQHCHSQEQSQYHEAC